MKSFKPVANPFKKRLKPSRPARLHGGASALGEDGLLTKKHPAGLRSPKNSPGRSERSKPRPGRTSLPRCGSSAGKTRTSSRNSVDLSVCAAGRSTPSGAKKRSRPNSRPGEPPSAGLAGQCGVDGGQNGACGSDNVKVLVRIRPLEPSDEHSAFDGGCVQQLCDESLAVVGTADPAQFSYDFVAGPDVKQERLFDVAGIPVVENCLRGYNSCVFAYGQTGSGKTHTMLGDLPASVGTEWLPSNAGLMPRIFQYLFRQITERQRQDPAVQYTCTCSLLEIYNETITDLLNPGRTNIQLREDVSRGVYAEDLTAESVADAQQAMEMLRRGSVNRRVAETNMNSESSRSHCVLTCVIESKTTDGNGFTNVLSSRLNLVDLAGSERQKTSGAIGGRLREASSINRSLSTLGLVIMSLTEGRKAKHVPYRDSKLTFLLQDSLGGNSKTVMIANVSPAHANLNETVGTLRFAQRTKFIKNTAVVNEDLKADPALLKQEILRLNQEVSRYRMICEAALNNSVPGVSGGPCSPDNNPPAASPVASTSSSQSTLQSIPEVGKWQPCMDWDWDSRHAYDIQLLQTRAEEAASKAVSDASRQIEEAFANAGRQARRTKDTKTSSRPSGRGRQRKSNNGMDEDGSSLREDRAKLMATLKSNQELQGQLLHLGEHVTGLTKEKALLEDRIAQERIRIEQAEARAREALLEATRAKEEVARLASEKQGVEDQLRVAANAKTEIESQCVEIAHELRCTHQELLLSVESNKSLRLKNKQLEEHVMGLMAEKENLLSKVKLLTESQKEKACRGVASDEEEDGCCNCSLEIIQLHGQVQEANDKTYKLMRQLEILTLQQDSEFREEFGSCKDQLVTLLKKLEEATDELNLLKHTLVERDSEVKDLQEYVAEYDGHIIQLEGELRAQLLAREDLMRKKAKLETELDNVRSAAQRGLEGGELLLVQGLQAELSDLRQENDRLSRGTEGKDSEIAGLKRELAYHKAVSHLVSEATQADVKAALFQGVRKSASPQCWQSSDEQMANDAGDGPQSKDMGGLVDVDMLDAEQEPMAIQGAQGNEASQQTLVTLL